MDYGADCGLPISLSTTSIATVPASKMTLNVTYAFTILVSSSDGRYASQTVQVTPSFSGSAQVSITSLFTRFNPSSKLVLNSTLSATYAVTSTWSVSTAHGVSFPFAALTSQTKSFTVGDAEAHVNFPLGADSGTFSAGNAYTFRLTVYPAQDTSHSTFTEMTLTANAAPTGGYISSSPSSGSALVTQFLLSSPGWTADAASFPLSYTFSYTLSPASPYLTVAAMSLRTFTTTTLPAGLSSQGSNVTVQAKATDIYLSLSTATTSVRVTLSATIDISAILTSSLKSASDNGDINLTIQTVNNVSPISYSHLHY